MADTPIVNPEVEQINEDYRRRQTVASKVSAATSLSMVLLTGLFLSLGLSSPKFRDVKQPPVLQKLVEQQDKLKGLRSAKAGLDNAAQFVRASEFNFRYKDFRPVLDREILRRKGNVTYLSALPEVKAYSQLRREKAEYSFKIASLGLGGVLLSFAGYMFATVRNQSRRKLELQQAKKVDYPTKI